MVGLRNIIAHDYEKINYDIVYEVLQKGAKDIEEYIGKIGGVKIRFDIQCNLM